MAVETETRDLSAPDALVAELAREFGGPVGIWDVGAGDWHRTDGTAAILWPGPCQVAGAAELFRRVDPFEVQIWEPDGPEGIAFYTRGKVVTSRWPDPATSSIDLGFPTHR